jgi:hypothetical protein
MDDCPNYNIEQTVLISTGGQPGRRERVTAVVHSFGGRGSPGSANPTEHIL